MPKVNGFFVGAAWYKEDDDDEGDEASVSLSPLFFVAWRTMRLLLDDDDLVA